MVRWIGRIALLGLVSVHTLYAAEQQLNGHLFTIPDGFEVEVAAQAPLIERPITADFDEQGRLYVTDSSGTNDPVVKQVVDRPHRIRRLVDTDGDGQFDKSTLFADKLMLPEGTLWHDGSLYVAAPPEIWKFTDTNDDGVSDKREVWFDGKTLTGCANDLHGPYLGPDGYIYWCKGAFAEQTYEQPGKPPLVTKASHLFRRRADGSGPVENVMTGGMDNPVDIAFTPGGERIFTTTFLQTPGGGLRDGMIHAVYGGVYGKVHNVTDFHPRTGDLMPPLVHMGAAAPCGLTRYESSVFGDDYHDNLFACQFSMYKVSRHQLQANGATFTSTDSDFITSNNLDFHPTDVLEDADGSLVICDTGGWYKLCCPTSQLDKPDVLGAIYRVRRSGVPQIEDPRGLKLSWNATGDKAVQVAELAHRLADPRPTVQHRAIRDLAKRPAADAISELAKRLTSNNTPQSRLNAIWTLTRINANEARQSVRQAIDDPDETVRHAALHSISLWRDREAVPRLLPLLSTGSPQDIRLASEILGRLEVKDAVPALIQAAGQPHNKQSGFLDRVLEHSITFALIEIADPEATAAGLSRLDPWVRRSVLIALDQMPHSQLAPDQVVSLLSSNSPALQAAALWLVGRHPEWGDAITSHLQTQLARNDLNAEELLELRELLVGFAQSPSVQQLLAHRVLGQRATESDRASCQLCLDVMLSSGLKQMPTDWLSAVTKLLSTETGSLQTTAIAIARTLPLPDSGTDELVSVLHRLAMQEGMNAELRVEAIAALPAGRNALEPVLFNLLISNIQDEAPVNLRSAAVEGLLKAQLTNDQLGSLADEMAKIGPIELNRLLAVFEPCSDEAVGARLVAALNKSPVLTSLRVDALKLRLAKFPPATQQAAEELYARINVEAAKQRERLDELVGLVGQGDIRRGQVVFGGAKAACMSCHAMGYKGGMVGPDLSRIGKIRTERDLLESILFPSVSLVRSYEPVLVVTTAGKQHNGLMKKETPDEILLATGPKEEVRVPRSEIELIKPSTVSVMPAGLDTQLTKEQILDLIAFLKSRQ